MGRGFLKNGKHKIDIIHTEVCSIHSNPSLHQDDQLVSQSLFADGFMKYGLSEETSSPHLKILAVHEEIIPDSINSMTWNVVDWGNQIYLAKEVPVLIARALKGYLKTLCEKARLPGADPSASPVRHPSWRPEDPSANPGTAWTERRSNVL